MLGERRKFEKGKNNEGRGSMTVEIAILCTVIGLLINLAMFLRTRKNDGAEIGKRAADIDYIKRRTDDILLEQRNANNTLGAHGERISRLEESVKQAHKRLDAISEKEEN